MIARISGKLQGIEGSAALIAPGEAGLVYEVSLPAYLAEPMRARVGTVLTLITLHYLEGQGQGASFVPRLIGFNTEEEKEFFEVFTTVKGIGPRKALRALAEPPGAIAAAISRKDVTGLVKLPEIGKRLAETIIAELTGKVERFMAVIDDEAGRAGGRVAEPPAAVEDAVSTLVALGETRADAQRLVLRAMERAARGGQRPESAAELVEAAVQLRG
jgi:Holliday junction DNA helicase RuvA